VAYFSCADNDTEDAVASTTYVDTRMFDRLT
jgi:hypothetical protein